MVHLISSLVPIIGFVVGAIFYVSGEPDHTQVGRMRILIAS